MSAQTVPEIPEKDITSMAWFQVFQTEREELIWIAKFLDDEGCLGIYHGKDLSCKRGFRWIVRGEFTTNHDETMTILREILNKYIDGGFLRRRRNYYKNGKEVFVP